MMKNSMIILVTFRAILRDRILHTLLGVALLLFLLVPIFSLFSMRQVQELSVSLCLSALSLVLLVLSILLGASSVWRDIERRYTASVLGLPVSRRSYLLGKFFGIALFLLGCTLILGLASALAIHFSALQYPSHRPVVWTNLAVAVTADGLRYILLTACALLFSALSTSFFLPIFGTLAVYFAGTASQQVMEYVSGDIGQKMPHIFKLLVKGVYYVIPNFSAFNFNVQAIYGLPITFADIGYCFLYFLIYTVILLSIAVWAFGRRELP